MDVLIYDNKYLMWSKGEKVESLFKWNFKHMKSIAEIPFWFHLLCIYFEFSKKREKEISYDLYCLPFAKSNIYTRHLLSWSLIWIRIVWDSLLTLAFFQFSNRYLISFQHDMKNCGEIYACNMNTEWHADVWSKINIPSIERHEQPSILQIHPHSHTHTEYRTCLCLRWR